MGRYFDDELYHHGVLGMKWGVHRKRQSYSSMTTKQKAKMDKKAERIVKKNNKLERKIAANKVAYRKNKYHAAGCIIDGVLVGAAGVAFAPTPGLKAAAAAYGVSSVHDVVSAGGNSRKKKQLDRGQKWLKDNGYSTTSKDIIVDTRKPLTPGSLGYERAKQYELQKRR